MLITNIKAKKILASLSDETVEATINDNFIASVPAGLSSGKYEVAKVTADEAIKQITEIDKICSGTDWSQQSLDDEIVNHNFGGNATLAVSAAFFKANQQSLTASHFPKLMLLLFEGGLHGSANIFAQEFMIIEDNVPQAEKDFALLRNHLTEKLVGAEGAFSPTNFNDQKCLTTIRELFPNKQIAIDIAGSFNNNLIDFKGLFSVEDPYDDEAWDKYTALNARREILVIGDDLTTTNPDRIKKAIDLNAIGAVVIKPNQIGTISQALQAVKLARAGGLKIVVSHRGQETNDTWIVDFAFQARADFVKLGGMDRGERIAKYNRLLEYQTAQLPSLTGS